MSLRWRPGLFVLVLPAWAALDYRIEPYEDSEIESSAGAALVAAVVSVPVALAAFALGKGLRAFALSLGSRNSPSP